MKRKEVNDIIECLGGEKRVFHYFKDRYCLDQLGFEMDKRSLSSITINEIKNSAMSGFLSKPIFKENLGYFGDGRIARSDLSLLAPTQAESFVLGLGCWGESDRGWDQTTRNQCNLVLRLEFTDTVNRQYEKLVQPTNHHGPFEAWYHPVSQGARKTMSWVRIDLDFTSNEALIEEVQNDWLRKASSSLAYLKRRISARPQSKPSTFIREMNGSLEDLEIYVNKFLAPYNKIWAEASLSAAINFIRNELGIEQIYYHTFDTGVKIKKVCGKPPRSMYTKLPTQFGFELVNEAPRFIELDKTSSRYLKAIKAHSWFRLA